MRRAGVDLTFLFWSAFDILFREAAKDTSIWTGIAVGSSYSFSALSCGVLIPLGPKIPVAASGSKQKA